VTAPVPPDLWGRIERMIDARVAAAMRSGPLRNASITGGEMIVQGGRLRVMYPDTEGGDAALYFGDIYNADDATERLGTGMMFQQPDGTDILSVRSDVDSGLPRATIRDAAGNTVIQTDRNIGEGLARPYISGAFYPARYADMTVSTTSATFETLWEAVIYKQHAYLLVGARASMDTAGATGETRVLVDGVQLGDVETEGYAIATNIWGPLPVAGDHLESLTVQIQGRRTSATGALRVAPRYVIGREPV
jgi:hypothetical protein